MRESEYDRNRLRLALETHFKAPMTLNTDTRPSAVNLSNRIYVAVQNIIVLALLDRATHTYICLCSIITSQKSSAVPFRKQELSPFKDPQQAYSRPPTTRKIT